MRATFYIDGLNLYYLRLKGQPQFKWINVKALADIIVPAGSKVDKVNYYCAHVSGSVDPNAPRRQNTFLAALKTVPNIDLHFGNMQPTQKFARLVQPPKAKPDAYIWNLPGPELVYIHKLEEKGSDVALGAHLVRDAFKNAFDVAYVVTNDTDLVEPIKIVTQEVGKQVCLVAPCRKIRNIVLPAKSLKDVSSFTHYIDDAELQRAQFPNNIPRNGKTALSRPPSWV